MVKRQSSRRHFIAGSMGIGALAITGCIGEDEPGDVGDDTVDDDDPAPDDDDSAPDDDDSGDDTEVDDAPPAEDAHLIRVGASTSGSTTFEIAQSIQRVLNDQSEVVAFDTQTTGGDPPGIRLWNDGEIDSYGVSNYTVITAMESRGPFDGEDLDLAYQGLSYFNRDDFFVALDGSGIETTDDLPGSNVWLLQPGWGTRAMTEDIFDADPDYREALYENSVDIDAEDVAGAVEEGNVDAIQAYGNNEVNLPSWLREVDARADLHYVEATDDYVEILQESDLTEYNERDVYGFEQDIGTDTLEVFTTPFQYHLDPEIPEDAAYELCQVCYDQWESMQDGMPAIFSYGEEPETFASAIDPNLPPVHPGVADFLEDNDLWEDDFERGG